MLFPLPEVPFLPYTYCEVSVMGIVHTPKWKSSPCPVAPAHRPLPPGGRGTAVTAPRSMRPQERSDPHTAVTVGEEQQAPWMAVLVGGSQQPQNKLWV